MSVNKSVVENLLKEVGPQHLVAATKYVGIEEINELESLGVKIFGENRVQSLIEKYEVYKGNCEWHFIGTLQRNKIKYIIDKVSLIHSVNTLDLLKDIDKHAKKHDLIMDILLQINIAKEDSKHGFDEEEIFEAVKESLKCTHIRLRGLMMMAPHIEVEETRQYFKRTKDVLDEIKTMYPDQMIDTLSMGMSEDYTVALEEGATYIRIGSLLFD